MYVYVYVHIYVCLCERESVCICVCECVHARIYPQSGFEVTVSGHHQTKIQTQLTLPSPKLSISPSCQNVHTYEKMYVLVSIHNPLPLPLTHLEVDLDGEGEDQDLEFGTFCCLQNRFLCCLSLFLACSSFNI